ncbi:MULTISPECIES: DUF6941 family protein [Pseudomonas syringae group]|uniref:Uncharacterized protein n=1 Tax=Pseudomonas syringae pv. pisi str. 1704B TaxID=629263 RepID=F3GGY1_PSESJ|nr:MULTISPECIES: hypothetical protein [Pseudomonas syringae group]EGH46331.1 hypothetical protein PSYPI_30106 [Pseudomonas syringae pv. pisi str. 1704B]PYD13577.1 hypothetical protein DND62_12080 [Pseudomonas syringae pv. pisi]PYD30985.1 hypothetical protein DND58_14295 [Pseudomonas syringae pv. pisi]PYD34505.1 hypothetical protein DND67_08090 [Pseudomonas syringae pv. pisi]
MRYAHAVYCDDIRHEDGNKISLMGIYSGQLGVPVFPCSLPKLCIVLSVSTPKEAIFKTLSLTGSYDESEIFKIEMGEEQINSIIGQTSKFGDGRFYMVQLMATLSPMHVEKPGKVTLDLLLDGEKLHCGGLQITGSDQV